MRLYKKIVIIVIRIFLILSLILFVLSRKILLIDFAKIENQNIIDNINRVESNIDEEVLEMKNLASGYAMTEETYINSNLFSISTLSEFEVNFMIFYDKDKNVKFSKWLNLYSNNEEPKDEYLEKELIDKLSNKKSSGIINTTKGPVIVASEAITNKKLDKPIKGFVIVGRYLDNRELKKLNKNLRLDIAYTNYDKNIIKGKNITSYKEIWIEDVSDKYKKGMFLLKDIDNKPCLIMNVMTERTMYIEFKKSMNLGITFLVVLTAIFIGIFFYEIHQLMTKRIAKISETVNKITKTKELSFILDEKGNDEITMLNKSFNKMIKTLRRYRNSIISNEKKYHSLFSNMTNGFCYNKLVTDENGNIIDFVILEINREFRHIVNMPTKQIVGYKATELLENNKKNVTLVKEIIKVAFNKGKKNFEPIYLERIGKWVLISVYSIESDYFAIIANDITDKKESEQKILQLAYYDSLTGLPNRKMLLEKIKESIINRNRSSILFIDLDNFKDINDTLGHDVGDKILQEVSYRLNSVTLKNDIIGRIGGDEFIILQNNITSIDSAKKLALEIMNILKVPIKYKDKELYIGASIGISVYPDDGVDVNTLMKNADIAMYKAKKAGEHSYKVYSKKMNDNSLDKLILENKLHQSITNNELRVFYQPIVDAAKMKIIGFEALLRWKHEDKFIYPSDFIPICEQTGFIVEVGEWVLRESCKQWRRWYDNDIKIYISVNITFKQIETPSFIEMVMSAIKDAKMDPKYLILEITENGTMQNVELAINVLNDIKKLGVRIALDDFGTGYSSLSHVNRLPIDILKIDRSLINNIETYDENFEIVKSIISMSHSLNIKVVTEGVETEDQLKVLKNLQSDSIQGYLISKPIPVDEAEKIVF